MEERFVRFHRFTDRSRRVIQLADKQAAELGHAATHTGHVLHGLIREGQGVAANTLRNCEIDSTALTPHIASSNLQHDEALAELAILDDAAWKITTKLGHNYVGTEHLLLGICAVPSCVAAQALTAVDVSFGLIGEEVLNLVGRLDITWQDCLAELG